VVDDTAVTPAYVHGLAADRELPIIRRIALGSLRNKVLFILPAALLLSAVAPTVVDLVLMLGGGYLCFEGAEKLHHRLTGHDDHAVPAAMAGADQEASTVAGAIRTDFILSAEIMAIALDEVIEEGFVSRAVILAVVAVLITVIVYGLVALIVKMDDAGLRLVERGGATGRRIGAGLVAGMPRLLAGLSAIGTAAMLWVGGHILIAGSDELGWHGPYDVVHTLEDAVHGVAVLGGVLAWLVDTAASALVGLAVGAVVVAVVARLPFGSRGDADPHHHGEAAS
jgi:predicted DNA repair protein MutK